MPRPWREGNRWRIKDPNTGKKLSFATETEAWQALGVHKYTAWESLYIYCEELADIHSVTTQHRLQAILPRHEPVEMSEARALELFGAYRAKPTRMGRPPAIATQRGTLVQLRTFWSWMQQQGWTHSNPWQDIKLRAKRRVKRKPQLGIDESKKLLSACLSEESHGGAAVATALVLGLRATEICSIQSRDIDDNGRLLWVRDTKNGEDRVVQVPELLRGVVEWLPQISHDRHWLLRECVRLCKAAGVPRVTPHGLRGTHATLARSAGATGDLVVRQLGHHSESVTKGHYYKPGTVQQADVISITKKLGGVK